MNPVRSFDEIYRQHAQAVYRVCLRAVSRREVAEELTSEVFLALHQGWSKITPEELPAWLFTVAKRRAADYWRRHYVEERWASARIEEPEWTTPEHSFAELLERCTALNAMHRVCLTLRFAQGMSRTEIAQHTHLSELQVKGNLQYALKLLREYIQPEKSTAKGEMRDGRNDAEITA